VDVLKEIGDRLIIELGGQTMVESNDRPRMTHGAKDVYYEDLPRGRTRETIERSNGDQIVTIRNRHGDILQRSRITPDGREYVLNYVDESHYRDDREWRDPGDDLPPMRLTIPRNRYILDSESVEDPDDYYEFLEQPPVEKVQRLYSVQEVKRSARVRDIARRIDLDTLTFEFGSASIPDSEVRKLEGVATAMERLLEKNPAETFLIEGHTDAVGTDNANLALSDRRAEAVAEALTNAFGIPPENLATQGYGERYLKVNTDAPERQNRRVAIRRITSLVAPVASAQ
jgi:outer membrane protein OmpA-like peptidoglycan-associated protein